MGCVRRVRGGGLCQRKRLSYGIGPKRLTLCKYHEKQFDIEQEAMLRRIESIDHSDGLHGEGEDRKQFATPHTDASGEHEVWCRTCKSELESETVGVRPEQLEQGRAIKRVRDHVYATNERVVARFQEMAERSLVSAIDGYGGQVKAADAATRLWRRVDSLVDQQVFMEGSYVTLNLAEAYEYVKAEQVKQLLADNIDDDEVRHAAALFVRLSTY